MTITAPPAGTGTTGMRFSVDGWDPSYGTSYELSDSLDATVREIAVDVEVPEADWAPIGLRAAPAPWQPQAVLFVDGVRRIDARVWVDGPAAVDGPSGATAALAASYAAGAVCCCPGRSHVGVVESRHGLFSVDPTAADITTSAGTYEASVAKQAARVPIMVALSEAMQRRLGQLEVLVAGEARARLAGHGVTGVDLLVVDGPLWGRSDLPRTIGYIKSHRATYLPDPLNAVVAALRPGERTPAFVMRTSWDRYSWYLRLPGPNGAPWAGVVRVEASSDLSASEAVDLARVSQHVLPRFASAPYKDTRAPQNLYPIGGLEKQLRHRMGDAALMYRALRQASLG